MPFRLVSCCIAALLLGCPPTDPVDDDDTAAPFVPPDWCPEPESGRQDVTDTDASPYYVSHPDTDALDVPMVVFLPGGAGGGGTSGHATATWDGIFSEADDGLARYRVVMPYSTTDSFPDEYRRSLDVLDEVLACFGGDPERVHVAGSSNGGRRAFTLMLTSPGTFRSMAGLPGYFEAWDADDAEEAFAGGKKAFHGVGEQDNADWLSGVEESHDLCEGVGIDSTHHVFPGIGHIPSPGWDDVTVLFDFWDGA